MTKSPNFFPITSALEPHIDPVDVPIPTNIIPNTAAISKPLSVLLCQMETRKRNQKKLKLFSNQPSCTKIGF